MEIVDCHMHLWTPQTHPWVLNVKDGGHPAGPFKDVLTYSVNEYVKDVGKYNVTHSVHVEACWPDDPVNETKWLDQIADSNPRQYPQAIVGHADLSADNLEDVLMRHCQSKRMRGIRHMLNFHSEKPQYSEVEHDNFLTDPKWQRGLELLEKYNLSFEIHILPRQMKRAAEVVSKYPKVWFMVDHCGIPYEKDDVSMTIWREGLTELAKYPNVFCKISGIFATTPSWDNDSFASIALTCIEAFTIDRCVFASNFPVDRVNGTFDQMVTALNEALKGYSEEDKKKVFSENGKKFYRL